MPMTNKKTVMDALDALQKQHPNDTPAINAHGTGEFDIYFRTDIEGDVSNVAHLSMTTFFSGSMAYTINLTTARQEVRERGTKPPPWYDKKDYYFKVRKPTYKAAIAWLNKHYPHEYAKHGITW